MALGDNRNDLFLDYVSRRQEDKEAWVTDTVSTFAKVTRDYHTYLLGDSNMKAIIENVVGQSASQSDTFGQTVIPCLDTIMEPLFQEELGSALLNEILVHIGLLKVACYTQWNHSLFEHNIVARR